MQKQIAKADTRTAAAVKYFFFLNIAGINTITVSITMAVKLIMSINFPPILFFTYLKQKQFNM